MAKRKASRPSKAAPKIAPSPKPAPIAATGSLPGAKNTYGYRLGTTDSFQNFLANVGIGTGNQNDSSQYGFNPISRIRLQMEYAYRGSWIAGRVIDCVAKDMTRKGVTINSDDDPSRIADFDKYIARLRLWSQLCETTKWARLYGGACAFIMIKGQNPSTPLRMETVEKGAFKGLLPMDRWLLNPTLDNLVEEYGPHYGKPVYYDTVADTMGMPAMRVHYTRMVRIEGVELPYWQKIGENLWGQSVLERTWDRLIAFDSTTAGAAQLVYKAHLRTFSVEGLRELIGSNSPALSAVVQNIQMIRAFQTNEGITLLDTKDKFETHQYTFSGLDAVLASFGEQLAGATEIPLVRLFGQSPAGFSTGESDIRSYYDSVQQQQMSMLGDQVEMLYRLAYISKFGAEPPDTFDLEWVPLWQMTPEANAGVVGTLTTAVNTAYESGLITKQTALKELKDSGRVTGVFTSITDEEIEDAEDEPPPGMEGMPGAEGAPGSPQTTPGTPGGAPPARVKEPTREAPAGQPAAQKAPAVKVRDALWRRVYRALFTRDDFDPAQPRVKSGPDAGQWTKEGAAASPTGQAVEKSWAKVNSTKEQHQKHKIGSAEHAAAFTEHMEAIKEWMGATAAHQQVLSQPPPKPKSQWKKIGEKKGSNPGGVYEFDGKQHYAKFYANEAQGKTEAFADKVTKLLGNTTTGSFNTEIDGKPAVASEMKTLHDAQLSKGTSHLTEPQKVDLAKMYVTALMTKNWDVVGLDYSNIAIDAHSGHLAQLDLGGTFNFRAQGKHKDYGKSTGDTNLLDPAQPSGKVFAPLMKEHPEYFVAAANAVNKAYIQNIEKLKEAFDESGLENKTQLWNDFNERLNDAVANTKQTALEQLKKNDEAKSAPKKTAAPSAPAPSKKPVGKAPINPMVFGKKMNSHSKLRHMMKLAHEVSGVQASTYVKQIIKCPPPPITPSNAQAVRSYVSSSGALNGSLRASNGAIPDGLKTTVARLDKMLNEAPDFNIPVRLTRGVPSKVVANLKPGETYTDHGYMSTSWSASKASNFGDGTTQLEITIPPGFKFLSVPSITAAAKSAGQPYHSLADDEGESILPRGTTLRLSHTEWKNGKQVYYVHAVANSLQPPGTEWISAKTKALKAKKAATANPEATP